MQRFYTLLAVGAVVAGCAAQTARQPDVSCEKYAERRAGQQYTAEADALSDRQFGNQDSALERDFIRMDAESYRAQAYRNCVQLRAGPGALPQQPPQDGG